MKCCICKKELKGTGNNANPIKDGRCCDSCNQLYVIKARIELLEKLQDIEKDENKGNNK